MEKHDIKDKKSLGQRLAACREIKGWKQDFAAREIGVTKAALSAWETGRNMPDALFLKKIAKLYEVSVDSILWENPVSNEGMQFAAQFDSLTERQRSTLKTVLMAFVQEGVSDERVEVALGEAQQRERQEAAARMAIAPPAPGGHVNRRVVVLGRTPERRAPEGLGDSPLTLRPADPGQGERKL